MKNVITDYLQPKNVITDYLQLQNYYLLFNYVNWNKAVFRPMSLVLCIKHL